MIAEFIMPAFMPGRAMRLVPRIAVLCAGALLFGACDGTGGTSAQDPAGSEGPSTEVPVSQRIDRNYPPLIKAILANDAAGVREALAAGADPNALVQKITPLGWALHGSRCAPDVIRALAEAGADLEAPIWPSNPTPLYLSLGRGNQACAEVLLEFGANIHFRGPFGDTTLLAAAKGGLLDMVNLSAERGVDINAVTTTGWTAMMFAALNGDEQMIRRMLELGTDPCVCEPNGRSAADIARGAGLAELARELNEICSR